MIDHAAQTLSAVGRRILHLPAELSRGFAFKDQLRRRQRHVPVVDAGRRVCAGEIRVLMTRLAFHTVLAVASFTALHVL